MTTASPLLLSLTNKEVNDMSRRRGQRTGWLREKSGSWLLTYRLYDQWGTAKKETVTVGPATGPGKLSQRQAERLAWDQYLSKVDQISIRPKSTMSVLQFWETKYWPSAQLRLKKSTRIQYGALFNKWIRDRIGKLPLAMVSMDHVEALLSESKAGGLAPASVRHVRKVVSAIFTRAKKAQYVTGDNPAGLVDLPDPTPVRKPYALEPGQASQVLRGEMPEPYREMAMAALLTGMNASELCGLTWGYVNLTAEYKTYNGETIPPFMIAVREHWYRGERGTLKNSETRPRNLPVCGQLLSLLREMSRRPDHVAPTSPVFAARNGKPLDEHNVARRYLNPIGKSMGLPYLGWHIFRHTYSTWLERAGAAAADRMALMGHASMDMTDRYTHDDRKRIQRSAEMVGQMLFVMDEQGGKVN